MEDSGEHGKLCAPLELENWEYFSNVKFGFWRHKTSTHYAVNWQLRFNIISFYANILPLSSSIWENNTCPEKPTLLVFIFNVLQDIFLCFTQQCIQENGASQLSLVSAVLFVLAISGRINATLTSLYVEQCWHCRHPMLLLRKKRCYKIWFLSELCIVMLVLVFYICLISWREEGRLPLHGV
jgi:hypothetical protein